MNLSDNVKVLIKNTAPTLLTALSLPPPFNLIASAVVSTALNKYLPGVAPASPQAQPVPAQPGQDQNPVTPDALVAAISTHVNDPQLAIDLRKAEIELQKYESDAGLHFAEIALDDKKSIREFQAETGISGKVFNSGMNLVYIALTGLGAVVVLAMCLVFFNKYIEFDATQGNLVTAAFGIVGTAVGFINGMASNIVGYYWGSSQGSKEKGVEINKIFQDLGSALATQSKAPPPPPPTPDNQDKGEAPSLETPDTEQKAPRIKPTHLTVIYTELQTLKDNHNYANKSVAWKLTPAGISIDNNSPLGSGGKLITVPHIWQSYGDICAKYAKRYNVPVELIVATIAVESAGDPNAFRQEKKDASYGLMQTLFGTARETLRMPDLKKEQLFDPDMSVNAGTCYIAQALSTTRFDPPKVAAAYNAGSLYLDDSPENRWKLRCYPLHTGHHINKFVGYFNDCMLLSKEQDWSHENSVPSFHAIF